MQHGAAWRSVITALGRGLISADFRNFLQPDMIENAPCTRIRTLCVWRPIQKPVDALNKQLRDRAQRAIFEGHDRDRTRLCGQLDR